MEYTPIVIRKQIKKVKGKEYVYYEARTTIQGLYNADGTPMRQTGSGKTRKSARLALLEKLDSVEKKKTTSVPVKSDTLETALDHFLEYRLREGGAESTFNRDQRTRRNQVMPYAIAKKHPLEVTHNDILEYMEELKKADCSLSTQDKAYSLIRLYYNYVYQNNPGNNPCYGIKIGYAPKLTEESVLSSDEAAEVFRACDRIGGNADLIKFAFMTYERPGEVSTLKFTDWRDKEKTIKITRTYTVDRYGHKIVSPDGVTKTKTSNREMKISEMANNIIKTRYNKEWRTKGKRPGDSYIWKRATDSTKPIDYNAVRRLLKKVLAEAGIEKKITPHGLRHSGITFYGTDRDQFLTISKNAGHARPDITENIYSHVLDEHEQAAVQSADNLNKKFQQ